MSLWTKEAREKRLHSRVRLLSESRSWQSESVCVSDCLITLISTLSLNWVRNLYSAFLLLYFCHNANFPFPFIDRNVVAVIDIELRLSQNIYSPKSILRSFSKCLWNGIFVGYSLLLPRFNFCVNFTILEKYQSLAISFLASRSPSAKVDQIWAITHY